MNRFLVTVLLSTVVVWGQPVVTAVLDGAAYTSDLAQGSVFVVKGTGLSAAGTFTGAPPRYPVALNGVSMTLTAVNGGAVVNPLMVYTYNQGAVNQLAAVLPSTAAVGAHDLRVVNGTTSAAFRVNVVARKPGIVTYSSDGVGPAQATLDGKRIFQRRSNEGKIGDFETRPALPGERVDLWGTGLGADVASDSGGTSGDLTAAGQIRVIVNGFEVTPTYAGRSQGLPGLDQIVFTLPSWTALNCLVDVQVRAGGALSNPVTISTSTGSACPAGALRINEVESNLGVPGDWVELYNPGPGSVDLNGYVFKDNDDSRNAVIRNAVVPAGGYYILEEADFVFGLGAADQARLYRPDGTLADSYTWTAHAATTYGRCPHGTGPMTTTTSPTKAEPNDCSSPVKINEIESEGGSPADWVELVNPSGLAVDVSGYTVRASTDARSYTLPGGSVIAAGGYLVVEQAALGFDLVAADAVRLFDRAGTLVDSYSWSAHASTTYGRCPDGTGALVTTASATKGAVNACVSDVSFSTWPGSSAVTIASGPQVFGGNLSGLNFDGAVVWGARNGPGSVFRLVLNGTTWTPDPANGWGSGKALRYRDGTGDPDAEGIVAVGGMLYVSTERDNSANGISRNSVLRVDPAGSGTTLTAAQEWNLTADLPTTGPNLGIEGITWVPDSYLTARALIDESKNRAYNPADYPNHGTGLFLVGLEANGSIYAYALDHVSGGFTRVATIVTGLPAVMDLHFDRDLNDLWAVCDDTCQGRSVVLRIDSSGKFTVARRFERPAGMPNLNNEGFTIAPISSCVGGNRTVLWADDGETDGRSIRSGTMPCLAP